MLEEALAKAIADKGAQLLNKSAFKQVAESIGKPISKTLRKLGFSPKVDLFGETLEGFTTKASKDILSELPITKFTSEDLVKIKDRTDGKRYEGEDVKVAGSILDLKSKGSALATRAKLFAKTDRGAGKKLELENRQREQRVAKHVKEAEFIVMDFNDALSNYIKDTKGVNEQETLDLIQEALTTDTSFGEGNANQSRFDALNLPEELITQIKRMRNKVDALTMSLQNDGVLVNEDIRAILNKNLGFYLNRTYQKHLVDNWAEKYKKLIPKEDFDRIQNYFRNQYETSNIASVNWSKTKDGGYIVSFKNTAGVRSDKVGKGVDSGKIKLESLDEVTDKFGQIGFSPADIIGLREAMEDTFDDDGNLKKTANSYTLQDETGEQDVIKFGMTSEQMDNLISSVVGNDKIVEDITLGRGIQTGIGASAGLGSVETGPLKKRKDIAEPVRILLGEIVDPRANFTNTVYKMANLLEKGKFENMLIREGERTFLTPNRTATNTVQLTEEDSRIFGNLQIGEETEAREYWTSPEIYDLLYGKVKPNSNPVIQSLIMMNGLAKAALTIGKPDSQARNYWGAVWNLASTGRMPQYLTTSAKVSFADATKTQRALSIMSSPLAVTLGVSTAINKKSVDEIREIHLEAAERGLLGENPQAGIVEDLVKYVDGSKTSFSTLEKIKDFQRRHFDNFSKPYQATDEVFKVSQWQQEIDDYTKFYPNKSKEEIMDITAEIVRKTQPTYSNSSKAEKLLSKTPLAGSFIMFSAQQYRTKVAIMQQAAKEIREGKQQNIPGMAALGRKRLAALAGISLITPTLAIMTRLAMGWSADEDEAISAGMPFYGQNNYRIYLNGDKKKPLFLDMTFVDPFSQFQKPFVAAWRGEDISDKIGGFISETADPFASPEIYTQRVLELFHNEDQYGKAIAKEEYGAIINTGRVLSHALDPFVPGYAKTFANIYKGAVDYSEDYGKEYSLANELTNVGLGVKVKERDTQKMYRSKISLARGIMNAARSNYAIKSKADRDTRLDIISQEKQYKLAVSKSKEKFDEIKKSMDHMIALGYNKAEISATLKEAKVPKYMIKQLFRGEFLGIFKQDIKVGGKVKAKKGDFVKYETLKYYKK